MKRLLLVAVALMMSIGVVRAQPVVADGGGPDGSSSLSTWTGLVGRAVTGVTDGWYERSICVGNTSTNQAWCLYFPWPI